MSEFSFKYCPMCGSQNCLFMGWATIMNKRISTMNWCCDCEIKTDEAYFSCTECDAN